MSTFIHAVVWLDRHHAQILQFDTTQISEQEVKAHIHYTRHYGSKVRSEHEFFDGICDELSGIEEVLVAGSHAVQTDFHHYVDKHRPAVAKQIVDWQTLDHPSVNELIALASRYFARHAAAVAIQG